MTARNILMAAAGASTDANYIEDVFSTHLRAGAGSVQTITNGIDLANKGGMIWVKQRNVTTNNCIFDTSRGPLVALTSNTLDANFTQSSSITQFNSDGFLSGPGGASYATGANGATVVSWTFRKQPKFFDVVTYTGNGVDGRPLAHNLGSVPGCIIIKSTSDPFAWMVWHQSAGQTSNLVLNSTAAVNTNFVIFGLANIPPTSTNIYLGSSNAVNGNGKTYVAYFFAHNAGGFGLTGTDNVISCGSYTGNGLGAGPVINLGFEPQWVMVKRAIGGVGNWYITDSMRGMTFKNASGDNYIHANTANVETAAEWLDPLATGFQITNGGTEFNASNNTYIYIAIRRGPMKVPTSGTSVFSPIAVNVGAGTAQTTGFVVDSQWKALRTSGDTLNSAVDDRLRGVSTDTATASFRYVITSSTAAEATTNATAFGWNNTGFLVGSYYSNKSSVFWNFGRAPGFFDVVCYTGTGANRTVPHNLAAAPELMIVKGRSVATAWVVYSSALANTERLVLNTTSAKSTDATTWNSTTPTSTEFSLGTAVVINSSGVTFVAYLFASCPGVSKVGSYTGTGTTQQINCGFTAGARFVLIKRTDSTGDWYVWDTARGIVAGNDPYLLLNSTAAEVTLTDYIDTFSSGFEISSTAPAAINASGGTYIFLAIA